jgi:glutamine synthetase adenylyltransferase
MALANNGRKLKSKLLTLTSTSKNRLYLLAVAHRCAAAIMLRTLIDQYLDSVTNSDLIAMSKYNRQRRLPVIRFRARVYEDQIDKIAKKFEQPSVSLVAMVCIDHAFKVEHDKIKNLYSQIPEE